MKGRALKKAVTVTWLSKINWHICGLGAYGQPEHILLSGSQFSQDKGVVVDTAAWSFLSFWELSVVSGHVAYGPLFS